MQRRRRGFAVVLAGLVAGMGGAAEAAGGVSGLSESRWLAPGADALAFLSETPGECLRSPQNEESRYLVEVGRAAFRSPLLLGGPAARNGLSCNSCHRDGRGNPDFFLAGLSSTPGTADITSSLFSKAREDGVLNAVPIPSLVGASDKASFGTMAPRPSLHDFIDSAVRDEFQGAPPAQAVLEGLSAYVSHLDAEACPEGRQRYGVGRSMGDVTRALTAARDALHRNDGAAGDFLLLAAQRELGAVFERYAGPHLVNERSEIASLSRRIGALRPAAATISQEAGETIDALLGDTQSLARRLGKARKKSLYDLQVLGRALEEAQTGKD